MTNLKWVKDENGDYCAKDETRRLKLHIDCDGEEDSFFAWEIDGLPEVAVPWEGSESSLKKAMLAAEAALPHVDELELMREEAEREWFKSLPLAKKYKQKCDCGCERKAVCCSVYDIGVAVARERKMKGREVFPPHTPSKEFRRGFAEGLTQTV